jgi:hypothetical protein
MHKSSVICFPLTGFLLKPPLGSRGSGWGWLFFGVVVAEQLDDFGVAFKGKKLLRPDEIVDVGESCKMPEFFE